MKKAQKFFLAFFVFLMAGAMGTQGQAVKQQTIPAQPDWNSIPRFFEPNVGQTDSQVRFLSRGPGYTLYLTGNEAVMVSRKLAPLLKPAFQAAPGLVPSEKSATAAADTYTPSVLRLELLGANPSPRIYGSEQQAGRSNYFKGRDRSKWHTNVPNFARVHYQQIYPGVNLVYYGNQRQLEYDFVVAPGSDPGRIALSIRGGSARVDDRGNMVVATTDGEMSLHKPVVYQMIADRRRLVDGRFVLANNRVSFAVGTYDRRRALVIDPVVTFSSFLGGSRDDRAAGASFDSHQNVYIAGSTGSDDFPTKNPIQGFMGNCPTCFDMFVTKMNPTGSALIYSTYVGGTGDDRAVAIKVDKTGNAYVVGETSSVDFPITAGAAQFKYGGAGSGSKGFLGDGVLFKLNAAGSALVYSTYLGGQDDEIIEDVAIDAAGNAYVGGMTGSTQAQHFPMTSGAFQTDCQIKSFWGTCFAGFVVKVNAMGSRFLYVTYMNDGDTSGFADTVQGIVVVTTGHAFVGGQMGPGFPTTAGAFQPSCGGSTTCSAVQGYVAELNPTGSQLVWGTYLGSTNNGGISEVLSVAMDTTGVYATGLFVANPTADFPVTTGAAQVFYGGDSGCKFFGCGDDFVSKLNTNGTGLVYSTYLGGTGDESPLKLAIDTQQNAYVVSQTTSTDFPQQNQVQPLGYGGGPHDGAITEVNATGTAFLFSSYLGGSADDIARGLAVDTTGNMYIAGRTNSANFPITAGAFQTKCGTDGTCNGGFLDAFVLRISPSADLMVTNSAPSTVISGSTLTYTITATNNGPDTALIVSLTDTIPTGTNFNSLTITSGTCKAPAPGGTGMVKCTIPVFNRSASTTLTLTVNVTALPGATIRDTAKVSFGGFDGTGRNNTAKATTSVH
jgi:uncharacterized repeat protein (TIGR01451 family)